MRRVLLVHPLVRLLHLVGFFTILSFSSVACSSSSPASGDAPDGSAGAAPPGEGGASPDGGHDQSGQLDGGRGDTSSGKRGLAYGLDSAADLAALSSGISWWYDWSPKPGVAPGGVEFVPMVWGGNFDVGALTRDIPAGSKYLLTFNEPNFQSQSNLTPEQAAALWPKLEAFAQSRKMKIVSPALNYCGGACNETNPFTWLDKFFAACSGCKVDYVALHWYACTKDALAGVIGQYETKYHRPLWLTEFSCLDSNTITEAGEEQYMRDAVALLEADPMVFRYAWFTGRFDQHHEIDLLAAASGQLTPLGRQYISLLPAHTGP